MPFSQHAVEPDTCFWSEKWYAREINQSVKDLEIGNQVLKEILGRFLPVKDPILDGGCGIGRWTIYLSDRGYNIVGLDADARIIERLAVFRSQMTWIAGNVLNVPYNDGAFGGFVSLGVFEHIQGRFNSALAEANRILRKGGVLILSVPFYSPFRMLLRSYQGADDRPFYQYLFLRDELLAVLENAGFRVEEVQPFDALRGLIAELPILDTLLRSRIRGSETGSTYRESSASGFISVLKRAVARLIESNLFRRAFGHMIVLASVKERNL